MGSQVCKLVRMVADALFGAIITVNKSGIGFPQPWRLVSELHSAGIEVVDPALNLAVDDLLDLGTRAQHLRGTLSHVVDAPAVVYVLGLLCFCFDQAVDVEAEGMRTLHDAVEEFELQVGVRGRLVQQLQQQGVCLLRRQEVVHDGAGRVRLDISGAVQVERLALVHESLLRRAGLGRRCEAIGGEGGLVSNASGALPGRWGSGRQRGRGMLDDALGGQQRLEQRALVDGGVQGGQHGQLEVGRLVVGAGLDAALALARDEGVHGGGWRECATWWSKMGAGMHGIGTRRRLGT